MAYFETQHEKFYLNSHRQTRPAQGGVGEEEQGSQQGDGCVWTFPMLTFNRKPHRAPGKDGGQPDDTSQEEEGQDVRKETPPKNGQANCDHDARLSIFCWCLFFKNNTVGISNHIILVTTCSTRPGFVTLHFSTTSMAICSMKNIHLIFAGAPHMSEWVRSWLGKHPSGVTST